MSSSSSLCSVAASSELANIRIVNNNTWFDMNSICKMMGSTQLLGPILTKCISPYNISSSDNGDGVIDWINEPGLYQLFLSGQLEGGSLIEYWLTTHLLPLVRAEIGQNIWAEYAVVASIELTEMTNEDGFIFIATCDRLRKEHIYIIDNAHNVSWWRTRQIDEDKDISWRTVVEFKSNNRVQSLERLTQYFAMRHLCNEYYFFIDDDDAKNMSLEYMKRK